MSILWQVVPELSTLFLKAPKDKGISKALDGALAKRPKLKKTKNNVTGAKYW